MSVFGTCCLFTRENEKDQLLALKKRLAQTYVFHTVVGRSIVKIYKLSRIHNLARVVEFCETQ